MFFTAWVALLYQTAMAGVELFAANSRIRFYYSFSTGATFFLPRFFSKLREILMWKVRAFSLAQSKGARWCR